MKSDMDSWARLIKTYDMMPDDFKGFLNDNISTYDPFPYVIYAPADRWGARKTNPKLLCLCDNKLFIFEKTKTDMISHCFLFEDIIDIEKGSVLLYSWIKITGKPNGILLSPIIEFNTVVDYLFKPIIEILRKKIPN